ncbi:MAG: sensor histidine kinase, partial [Limisphaerales bacterium]
YRITRSAQRLDALVNDLLSYSRITRGKLAFDTVALDKVLPDVQTSLCELLRGAKLHIGPMFTVSAHESTLHLVITNLLSNAVKFVAPGVVPEVKVWAEERGEMIRLWVEDNGIGINAAGLAKIFGVFERLHPINVYPGTGIGLAIVKKAVERMGGSVGVESEPGKGSRFWIELRRGDAQHLPK